MFEIIKVYLFFLKKVLGGGFVINIKIGQIDNRIFYARIELN